MSPRLLGQVTRGKTAPNRLRKTDTFLAVAYPEFVRHMPGLTGHSLQHILPVH